MPPDVYVGRTVCGAGKLKTWDGGRLWTIIDAVPIPQGQPAMRKFMELLDSVVADPNAWCPDIMASKRKQFL